MQVISTTKFKRCRDGTTVNEFCLDESVTEQFLDYLRNFGTVTIIAHLDPPFYSFTMVDHFILKGMVDDTSLHIRFPSDQHEAGRARFEALLSHYDRGMPENGRSEPRLLQNPREDE